MTTTAATAAEGRTKTETEAAGSRRRTGSWAERAAAGSWRKMKAAEVTGLEVAVTAEEAGGLNPRTACTSDPPEQPQSQEMTGG